MKKLLIYGAVLTVAVLSNSALALDRANTAQKGSLLVFPKIDVSAGHDSLIRIENGYSADVDVKCYWQNGTKHSSDFQFQLTKFQPHVIIASETFPTDTGPLAAGPVARGELKCWAVSPDGQTEVSWNHLSGSATIIDFEAATAHEYTAWAFRCLVEAGNPGVDCGTSPGILELNGDEYERCPLKLSTGFSPTGAFGGLFGPSQLTVATCNQDLRQDKQLYYTKLDFKVWREDETLFTGAYSCIDSWHETTLDGIQNNPQNFSLSILGNNARFEVQGVRSTVCPVLTANAGLVGVISTEIGANVIGTNLVGFGEINGFIAYDTLGPIPEIPPISSEPTVPRH